MTEIKYQEYMRYFQSWLLIRIVDKQHVKPTTGNKIYIPIACQVKA
jgi:hypothetical protein